LNSEVRATDRRKEVTDLKNLKNGSSEIRNQNWIRTESWVRGEFQSWKRHLLISNQKVKFVDLQLEYLNCLNKQNFGSEVLCSKKFINISFMSQN